MTQTKYDIARDRIAAAETVQELRAVTEGFSLGDFSSAEDAELTKAYHDKWSELKARAREARDDG